MKFTVAKFVVSALLITACLPSVAPAQQTAAQKYLISVERIWERSQHNAFTDLVEFNGKLYAPFAKARRMCPAKKA